jgi:DsbC/DsbD-like thiol-disulfide interchange protein
MRQAICVAAVLIAATGTVGRAQSSRPKAPQRLSVAVELPAKPVAAGDRFALSLRIVPNPGIHVYAPGNPENIPVSISVTPSAGVTAEEAKFPKAEDFFFGPTGETLKVYTKPFLVEVPLRAARGATSGAEHEIAITGAVRYQACDDRVCFPPQSLPFEARVPLRTERR